MLEDNETFNLIITEESLPKYVILGEINITEVTIVNDGGSGEYASVNDIYIIANAGQ